MSVKLRTIEVDAKTADVLEARAAARGLSVSPGVLAEDARRLADFQRTREAMPWEDVLAWMRSWGTPDELPPPKPRKL